jgi:solute carrier family 45, member 1/2/4
VGSVNSRDTLGDVGRLGSHSLVIFSLVTFISSVLLPLGVQGPDASFSPRPPPGIAALLSKMTTFRPDLQTAWLISHIMFAATMVFAPLARSVRLATFLVTVCGIPWAVTCWAPFAFMGMEINRLASDHSANGGPSTGMTSSSLRRGGYRPLEGNERSADVELDVLRVNHRGSDDDSDHESGSTTSSTGELAGIYLGVLNVYTTIPQLLSTLISWIVFIVLEPAPAKSASGGQLPDPQAPPGTAHEGEWMNLNADAPNGIAVTLFIGAISALIAAEMTRRLRFVR